MLIGNFVMSASAPLCTPIKFLAALLLGASLGVAGMSQALAQDNSVPVTALSELVSRVRESSPAEVASLNAITVARRLLVEQRYSEADELYKALLEKLPREPALLYGAALAKFNLDRPAEGEPLARAAAEIILRGDSDENARKFLPLEKRQRAADALVLLALILGKRGADAEALRTVRRAVMVEPEHFDAQFTLGRALFGVGEPAAAIVAFRAAVKIKPDDGRALFFLATALESAGDYAGALKAYQDLVARKPNAAEGYLGLGGLLLKRDGKTDKGIQELRIAVSLDPNLYEAQVTLGRALLIRNRAEESVQYLQRAAALAPTNPEPHYQLALAYRRLGLKEKANEESAIVKRIHESRRGTRDQNNEAQRP